MIYTKDRHGNASQVRLFSVTKLGIIIPFRRKSVENHHLSLVPVMHHLSDTNIFSFS
ncbi:hypothetical protein AALP_AA4G089000 [Arabis alpina]|uniref:Uncharacterized protein n=1 Tax=Arabis alpina TaxID=50452 RepID=A0A087H231_ARAAL|nr:hypothetical protein AALP_AA4G089000 [Arabis alpina]